MSRVRSVLLVLLLATSPAFAITFSYTQFGSTIPSDCPGGIPPQPLCTVIDVTGAANDLGDVIPGQWAVTMHGTVLFGVGSGTFLFDDTSAANNDFFGTWTNVLFPPDPVTGIAHTDFQWIVTGGTGIFAGGTGFGESEGDVVVAPSATGGFLAACPDAQPGIGSYCDRGTFVIAEPATLALAILGCLLATAVIRRGRRPSAML